jgi:hypothetical protein
MKSNIVKLIYFVFAASLFTNCHENQARAGYKEGNITGRWEWIRSEVTFALPGTVLTPQSEGQTKTYIFQPDSTFQQLVNGHTVASGTFQLKDYGVEESGLHFYGVTFDTPQEMDWKTTSLRWTDAATIMMDYSPLDGPRVYYKRVQQQDTEK